MSQQSAPARIPITYDETVRRSFFWYGSLPEPSIRTILGRVFDYEKRHYLGHTPGHSRNVSPLQSAMIRDIYYVPLVTSPDLASQLHPDYAVAHRDFLVRLSNLPSNHPFTKMLGASAQTEELTIFDKYVSFLWSVANPRLDQFESLSLGESRTIELKLDTSVVREPTFHALRSHRH